MSMQSYDQDIQNGIREEFTWIEDETYLDYAAAGLYSRKQIEEIGNGLCSRIYGNPHSLNDASRTCSEIIDQVRCRILNLFHTSSETYTVIFTAGATSAIKLLLESFEWGGNADESEDGGSDDEEFYDANAGVGSYVYTCSNHTSVVGGRLIAKERGASVICLQDEIADRLLSLKHDFNTTKERKSNSTNSLFAYPAQCNFSGKLFPLNWLRAVRNGALEDHPDVLENNCNWFTLLDAATFCSTNELDLSAVEPDFVCLSFYKIFGYPTGLGALLVRNASSHCLRRRYFGGGTVDVAIPSTSYHKLRKSLCASFEDGTLPFLSIISLSHGLDTLTRLGLTMRQISGHVHLLAHHAIDVMTSMKHWNGQPMVQVYCDCQDRQHKSHGSIVAFNLRRTNGSYIGFSEVQKVANSYKILLRTGCFCNIGACQKYLNITDAQMMDNYQKGHVCGDEQDLIEGKPTGAVRVSFGYPSTSSDVDALIGMLTQSFLETAPSQNEIQLPQGDSVTLKGIRLYPVKSCGAMDVPKWRVTSRGLYMDRTWMVVTKLGVCLTQKDEPMLCRIVPSFDLSSHTLQLSFAGSDIISIEYMSRGEEGSNCSNRVCGDGVSGVDCGEAVAEWLDRHLNRTGLRLVQQRPADLRQSKRRGDSANTGQLSLANQAQYLVINTASVEYLQHCITNQYGVELASLEDRFRANFIVQGPTAFQEMDWKRLNISNVAMKVDGPCSRCQMICIDQTTGDKDTKPLVELSKALGGKLRFGIYCSNMSFVEGQEVAVGDTIFTN